MKEKSVNTLDALFREGMEDARVQPSDEVWANIRKELDKQPEEAVVAFPWKMWMAAASIGVVLAVGLTFLLNRPTQGQEPDTLADTHLQHSLPESVSHETTPRTIDLSQPTPSTLAAGERSGKAGDIPPEFSGEAGNQPAHIAFVKKDQQESSDPGLVIKHTAQFVASSLQLREPGTLMEHHLPMRSGHDLDAPYAFYSQDEMMARNGEFVPFEEKQEEIKRWAVGGVFSPDFSLSTGGLALIPSARHAEVVSQDQLSSFSNAPGTYQDLPSRAFSSGVNLAFSVSEKLELQGGVTFSQRTSTDVKQTVLVKPDNVTTGWGTANEASSTEYAPYFSNTYLEVPVTMKYRLRPEKKLDVYLTSGVSTQLFVSNETRIESSTMDLRAQSSSSVDPLTPYQLNVLVGGGAEFAFNEHMSVNVEPLLRRAVVADDQVFAGNPSTSMSLRTGLSYRF